ASESITAQPSPVIGTQPGESRNPTGEGRGTHRGNFVTDTFKSPVLAAAPLDRAVGIARSMCELLGTAAAVQRTMVQKLNVTAKTNVASSEPGASQYVVRFTSLYLNPINGPRRTSELKPDACVRSTTIPSRNQSAGEALSSDQL